MVPMQVTRKQQQDEGRQVVDWMLNEITCSCETTKKLEKYGNHGKHRETERPALNGPRVTLLELKGVDVKLTNLKI